MSEFIRRIKCDRCGLWRTIEETVARVMDGAHERVCLFCIEDERVREPEIAP